MEVFGGCLCRAVRYRLVGPPLFVTQCCCKDCQKATGTGHTTILGVRRSQLIIEGRLKAYTNKGDSGGEVTRHFCDICGGRVFTSGSMPGEVILVQAGSLDDPNTIEPTAVIYIKDSVRWDRFDERLPKYSEMQTFEANVLAIMRS